MHIYTQSIAKLIVCVIVVGIAWTLLIRWFGKSTWFKRLSAVIAIIAIYGIFLYTVLGRVGSNEHIFVFTATPSNEFYREMFMNAFLYFPFGLALSILIGPWSILAAFVLSSGIETWQYYAGTGLAQGTDVICNTLGCVIGTIPYLAVNLIHRK